MAAVLSFNDTTQDAADGAATATTARSNGASAADYYSVQIAQRVHSSN